MAGRNKGRVPALIPKERSVDQVKHTCSNRIDVGYILATTAHALSNSAACDCETMSAHLVLPTMHTHRQRHDSQHALYEKTKHGRMAILAGLEEGEKERSVPLTRPKRGQIGNSLQTTEWRYASPPPPEKRKLLGLRQLRSALPRSLRPGRPWHS